MTLDTAGSASARSTRIARCRGRLPLPPSQRRTLAPGSAAARSCTHKGKRDSLSGADVIQSSKQREIEDAGTARSDGCGMGDHLARCCLTSRGAFHGWTTGGRSAGSFTSCAPARRGATFRNAAGHIRQYATAATAGPGKECGSACSGRWRRARRDLFISSTPRWCAPTGTPQAEKRGSGSRHRTLERRAEHQKSTSSSTALAGPGHRRRPRPMTPRAILKLIADHGSCPPHPDPNGIAGSGARHPMTSTANAISWNASSTSSSTSEASRPAITSLQETSSPQSPSPACRLWIKTNEYTT